VKRIYIVDGFCLLFRAFYAIPSLTRSDGLNIGALYGFLSSMIKLIKEESPEHILIALDSPGPGVRHDLYPEYKQNRSEAPPEIIEQIERFTEMLDALNFPHVSCPRYEADDIIASYAKEATRKGYEAVIVSSDKDLAQLVGDGVYILHPSTMQKQDRSGVHEKFGVDPESIKEYLMLVGDSSDNVPGVRGVGPKTALKLLHKYQNIDGIYEHIHALTPSAQKAFENFKPFRSVAEKLIELRDDLEKTLPIEQTLWKGLTEKSADDVVRRYEFFSLKNKIFSLIQKEEKEAVCQQVFSLNEHEQKFCEEVRLASRLACIPFGENYFFSTHNQKVYECTVIPECVEALIQQKEIQLVVWSVRSFVDEVSAARCDDLQVLLYLSFGIIALKDVHRVPEVMDILGSCEGDEISIACAVSACALDLYDLCIQRLQKQKLIAWYKTVELPLLNALSSMEERGVKIDAKALKSLEKTLIHSMQADEADVFEHAGCQFNLGSSQQLATVLYDQKKLLNQSKSRSTDAGVLEAIADHPLVKSLLRWRHSRKLLTTYILPLQKKAINSVIHTHFTSTHTLSGRFSSFNPNMQNIPIRTEEGRLIREAFVAREGYQFLVCDYSQIELRLLAHFADNGLLMKSFEQGKDIHTATASVVFDVPESEVSKEQRRYAKTVNFGLIYGMGASSLATMLKVTKEKAKELLEACLGRFSEIQGYIAAMQSHAERAGYIETVVGRRCYLPGISSERSHEKAHAHRQAINIPLQASNADIMKIAMVRIQEALCDYDAFLVLQVHDELILEVRKQDVDNVAEILRTVMEAVMHLRVSLPVNISVGDNWHTMTTIARP